MDENLMNSVPEGEIVDLPMEDVESDIAAEEIVSTIVVEQEEEEEVVIDIGESMGWVRGDDRYHDSLLGVDSPKQHPIEAITNLREELNEIERLKTVYSDKFNVANYYKWKDAAYDTHGYFVSIVDSDKIQLCNGEAIFGVVVKGGELPDAGFIGGQDVVLRDNTYGLVVTSGLVDVRCELDVNVGDFVVSNSSGYAKKSASNYGYRVLGTATKNGILYAVIALGAQADVTNALGKNLQAIDTRLNTAETNILSAINVANQAYNKAGESAAISDELIDKVKDAVINSQNAVDDVKSMNEVLTSTSVAATQAKAIADSVAVYAETMRKDVSEDIEETWGKIGELTTDIESVKDESGKAMSAVIRNGKEMRSLIAVVDKYSVGECSQADGLTLDQAQSILEVGMVYVPTIRHDEKYAYIDGNENPRELTRSFIPGYLYKWGKTNDGLYGWITVDKSYDPTGEEDADETNEINTSSMAVYFSNIEILLGGNNNYGYWYTNGDDVESISGITYEPYTLYKWEMPDGEDGYWLAVATLIGNVNNRAVSQVRQTANEIANEIINTYGSIASFGAKLTATESTVGSLAAWKNGDGEVGEAIIRQEAKDGQASIVISTLQRNEDNEIEESASLVLRSIKNKDDTGSLLAIGADNINLNGAVTANNNVVIDTDGKITAVNANITGNITAISGYIGSDTSGFEISDKAIRNRYNISKSGYQYDVLHMTSYKEFMNGYNGSMWDGYFFDGEKKVNRDYIYVGTDGVGTYSINKTDGLGKITDVSQTWMANGELFSNKGNIGGWEITPDGLKNTSESFGVIISDGQDCETAIKYGSIINRSLVENGDYSKYTMMELNSGEQLFTRIYSGQVRKATFRWYVEGESVDPVTNNYIIPFQIYSDDSMVIAVGGTGELRGTWQSTSAIKNVSWRGAKHDIESLSDKYSILFDNLNPVRYKYNDGQSDRYHTGFILDELKDAMNIAGIDNSELAAYCVDNEETGEGGIRYEEIIALNTREVQKLKARVAELENRIATMTGQN